MLNVGHLVRQRSARVGHHVRVSGEGLKRWLSGDVDTDGRREEKMMDVKKTVSVTKPIQQSRVVIEDFEWRKIQLELDMSKDRRLVRSVYEGVDFPEGDVRKRVYIAGIPKNSKREEIIEKLQIVGEVEHLDLLDFDPLTDLHSGRAQAVFKTADQADRAVKELNGVRFIKTAPVVKDELFTYRPPETISLLLMEERRGAGASRKVMVGRIPALMSPETIAEYAGHLGSVLGVKRYKTHDGNHLGLACIEFLSADEAVEAADKLHLAYLLGRRLRAALVTSADAESYFVEKTKRPRKAKMLI
ncbi:hypothetical protein NDN08_005710 [Rhodosorus marinus]|uniref:RRM domain-containing protein n=1 Tax=Rhodosorus marinus TaxID=101924 RepID=A0AAV8V5G5_9RHOD|nr:hypothetical protein NDN08_005710 [Rhodosorus marinus]